jgi:uncharacterized RDD family membrane protein YckC
VTDFPPQLPPPPPPTPPLGGPPPWGGERPYPTPPPTSRADLPTSGKGSLASVLQRVVARLLDLILLVVPLQIVAASAGLIHTNGNEATIDTPEWFLVLTVALPVVYEFLMTGWRGQTVGKMILRVRVVRYSDGGRATWQQSAFRALVPAVPQFLALMLPTSAEVFRFVLSLAGAWIYISALFDALLRGIHDRAAGTIVLRTR